MCIRDRKMPGLLLVPVAPWLLRTPPPGAPWNGFLWLVRDSPLGFRTYRYHAPAVSMTYIYIRSRYSFILRRSPALLLLLLVMTLLFAPTRRPLFFPSRLAKDVRKTDRWWRLTAPKINLLTWLLYSHIDLKKRKKRHSSKLVSSLLSRVNYSSEASF